MLADALHQTRTKVKDVEGNSSEIEFHRLTHRFAVFVDDFVGERVWRDAPAFGGDENFEATPVAEIFPERRITGFADPATLDTNIVIADVEDAIALEAKFREEGVWVIAISETQVRVVTHRDVGDAGVDRIVAVANRQKF